MSRQGLFNVGLVLAGITYLVFVLFENISSPLIAMLLVSLAVYRLVDSHRARKRL